MNKLKDEDTLFSYLSEDNMWETLKEEQKKKTPDATQGELFWAIFAKGNLLFW